MPPLLTIIVTLDIICNSCDVFYLCLLKLVHGMIFVHEYNCFSFGFPRDNFDYYLYIYYTYENIYS